MTKRIPARIVVENVPNPVIRVFHTTVAISEDPIQRFMLPLRESSNEYLQKLGSVGEALVKRLAAVHGLKTITITPFDVGVEIGMAFRWQDLEEDVLAIVKECFGERSCEVEISRTTMTISLEGIASHYPTLDDLDDLPGDRAVEDGGGVPWYNDSR